MDIGYLIVLSGILLIFFYYQRRALRWLLYSGYGLIQVGITLNMTVPLMLAETHAARAAGVGITVVGLSKTTLELMFIRHLMNE